MKHKMSIFSPAGDSAVAEWEAEDATSVEQARGVFDAAVRDGWGAVAPTPAGCEKVEKFSPALEEIYLLRPIAGG